MTLGVMIVTLIGLVFVTIVKRQYAMMIHAKSMVEVVVQDMYVMTVVKIIFGVRSVMSMFMRITIVKTICVILVIAIEMATMMMTVAAAVKKSYAATITNLPLSSTRCPRMIMCI
jgi:hypothetical protein